MDDRIRVSDADREHATSRLREHFAEGRLTQDELDERISAALNAKTFGDLRHVMADLPEPVPAPPRPARPPQWVGPHPVVRHRGPRVVPLVALVLLAALIFPSGGWLLFGVFKLLLLFWLVTCVAGFFAAGLARRHMHHHGHPGYRRRGRRDIWL